MTAVLQVLSQRGVFLSPAEQTVDCGTMTTLNEVIQIQAVAHADAITATGYATAATRYATAATGYATAARHNCALTIRP